MARTTASDMTVDRDRLTEFLRTRHQAVLGTWRHDGTPQLSPVTLGIGDNGDPLIATYPERAKVKNLRRRPDATLCVLSDSFNGQWVQVGGRAGVVDLPEALDGLVEYFRSISGEHPDWDGYRQAMVDQGKVLVRVVVDRWGPVSQGGFPPRLADS